jgi:asparagine synthase (glutamine-hydrolysing)
MRVNREDRFEVQPIRDADLVLVADCRIDNREELAEVLRIGEDALALLPDSALILLAYREWGRDFLARLTGEFAFALWDSGRGELILARDPMGERCLYYHRNDRFLVFATEIKAIWAVPDIPCILSETEIGRYLLFQRPADDCTTFFEGVTYAPGGHFVRVRRDGVLTTQRYWEPRADPAHIDRDEAYYVETYRRLLTEAVDCRIRRAIRPPALLLSAGFDSAAIAGLAQPRLAAQGRKLIAVSSVLPEDYAGPHTSVRPFVEACRRVMPQLDVRYFVQTSETVFTDLERSSAAADAPAAGVHYLRDALYRRAAQAGARVVMDGFGGDGTINPRLGNVLAHFLRQGRLALFLREFAAQLRVGDQSFREIAINTAKQLIPDRIKRVRRMFRPPGRGRLVAPRFAADLARAGAVDLDDLGMGPRPDLTPRELMLVQIKAWLGNNRRLNANEAASCGLELTRPFRDRRIVEFALAIPEELWIKNGRRRYLARKALADVYPPEFQTRDARQDSMEPVPMQGMTRALPEVRAELERLGADPQLRKYIDFDAALHGCDGWRPDRSEALLLKRALCMAKFAEATLRANRAPTP